MKIIKRNGIEVPFDSSKITNAVKKAILEIEPDNDEKAENKAKIVTQMVMINLPEGEQPTVEIVQDLVENALMDLRMNDVAKAYVLYRYEHQKERSRKEKTMDFLHGKFMDITSKGIESEVNKGASGNANVDTESAMGKMLSYGAEFSKTMALDTLVSPEFAKAHKEGRIHIHDLDFLPTKTLTCCQIDLEKLFKKGFSTGHGFLREPQSIGSYASLAAIALQANQNDQHE